MLHVTNGDSVVMTMHDAAFPGRYLAWRDVLHDGPVPQHATLEELSAVRAAALAAFGWASEAGLRADFAERDAALSGCTNEDEVVLWFEHDLYDQLQLLQLLDWFAQRGAAAPPLSLVQIDAYPGVEPFHGLGQLDADQLTGLLPRRREVTAEQLASGKAAWRAFCAPAPAELASWAHRDSPGLPFLRAAVRRLLEEYPWTSDGLARSERQILRAVADGAATKPDIYAATREREACPWGDSSVYLRVDGLADAGRPALERRARERYALTDDGRALLDGAADWLALSGIDRWIGVDRWIGGVHLDGAARAWRWNDAEEALVAPSA